MSTYNTRLNSEFLRRRLKELGVNQSWLASIMSVSRQTASTWARRSPGIEPDKLKALALVLKTSEAELSLDSVDEVTASLPEIRFQGIAVQYDPKIPGSIEKAGEQLRLTIAAVYGAGEKQAELFEKLTAEALRGLGAGAPAASQ